MRVYLTYFVVLGGVLTLCLAGGVYLARPVNAVAVAERSTATSGATRQQTEIAPQLEPVALSHRTLFVAPAGPSHRVNNGERARALKLAKAIRRAIVEKKRKARTVARRPKLTVPVMSYAPQPSYPFFRD